MPVYDLNFVDVADVNALYSWGASAQVDQTWAWPNISQITFTNAATMSVLDDDTTFDDDDGFSWSPHGNADSDPQVLASDLVTSSGTYAAGTVTEPESTATFQDSLGNTYELVAIGVNEDANAIIGFAFVGAQPPFDTTLSVVSASTADLPIVAFSSLEPPICFAAGTLIDTPRDAVAVETLSPGDLVDTLDHGPQPVRLVASRRMDFVADGPRHQPILIRAGALGPGSPARDLCVSPQHRILMEDADDVPVLLAAKALTGRPGIRVMRGLRQVVYVHVMFSQHEILSANGALSESFYPGPQAVRSVTAETRAELFDIYPMLRAEFDRPAIPPARPLMPVQRAKRIANSLHAPRRAG
ncbi:Hint domain-containing protein [Actibacterium ureilyticum]|uniref:Hint domain-containing protein n=1 Tax=Actibacterium ureilyticum TaxID=1590614 RepID=UPI000BAAA910|nr:Hint domain-containing protein [Actibacterium ureilyticum]